MSDLHPQLYVVCGGIVTPMGGECLICQRDALRADLAEARDEVAGLKAGLQQVTRVSHDTSISNEVLRRELLAIVEYALKPPST